MLVEGIICCACSGILTQGPTSGNTLTFQYLDDLLMPEGQKSYL